MMRQRKGWIGNTCHRCQLGMRGFVVVVIRVVQVLGVKRARIKYCSEGGDGKTRLTWTVEVGFRAR